MASNSVKTLAVASALFLAQLGGAGAQDLDALFLGGYWCNTQTDAKSENIPRNRGFLLSRRIDGTPEETFTERLIDIVGDVRGQRIILAQRLKNSDGTNCKNNCTLAERVVHKDLLEVGDWNSSTGVFKSNSPREYVHRCEK
ncbi:MAG: hypothetical protein WDN31_13910 [Hyphomicrobium sp.]